MPLVDRLKRRAHLLKRDTYALYLAARHPRTPWYARFVAALVVAYALSPIDLIPDFIPVLGYLDDLIIVPAGIALLLRLVPPEVLSECRAQAAAQVDRPMSRAGALVVLAIWIFVLSLAVVVVRDHLD